MGATGLEPVTPSVRPLSDPSIQWVMIGSWNCFHARQAVMAMEAGKHVFCEKPLATTLEDCLAMRDAVTRTGQSFVLGLVLRYAPLYRRAQELIKGGLLGTLISFEFNETLTHEHGGYAFGNWRRKAVNGGSMVLEKCCHDLDIANWMCGSLPVRVASFGGRRVFIPENRSFVDRVGAGPNGPAYCSWRDPHRVHPFSGDADLLDHQVTILEYANQVRATFHINALPRSQNVACT